MIGYQTGQKNSCLVIWTRVVSLEWDVQNKDGHGLKRWRERQRRRRRGRGLTVCPELIAGFFFPPLFSFVLLIKYVT